jgi:hypothetical protein
MLFPGMKRTRSTDYSLVNIDQKQANANAANSTTPSIVAEWPGGPRCAVGTQLWIVADFLLLLMPVAFIGMLPIYMLSTIDNAIPTALAAIAYSLDGEWLSSYGRMVQEATLIAPTLYPLASAALAGRSLKKMVYGEPKKGQLWE